MMKKKQVWIDTDLSVGMTRHRGPGYCDVDDGYAVLQLMKADNVEIRGISAVFGNTIIENAIKLSHFMNEEFADGKLPVFEGAGKALDLKNIQTNEAVEALAQELRQTKMIIMAIGPATNVGLLLLLYPDLASQIEEVVLVAGRRKHTDYFSIGNQGRRAQDLNFDLDNDSFRIMFEHKVKVVLCPFEISNKVWVKKVDLDKIAEGDAGNKWIAKESENWLSQWIQLGADGFNPFDVLASHYIIAPEDIISEEINAHLEIHIDDTVQEDNNNRVFKQYLICDKTDGFPVTYCYDVVSDYHKKLIDSFKN